MLIPVPVVIDGDEYMERAELARYLNVTPSTISSWASRGKMPPPTRHIARSPLWRTADIQEWQAKRPGKGWRGQL